MKISKTITEWLLIKALSNDDYESVDFALVQLDEKAINLIKDRAAVARLFIGDDSFYNLTYWNWDCIFYKAGDKHRGLMDLMQRKQHIAAFVKMEEGESPDDFEKPDKRLDAPRVSFTASGSFHYLANDRDDSAEYFTETVPLQILLDYKKFIYRPPMYAHNSNQL